MKAISIRQPWADLIIQGKKKLELRTWSVKYRGPLAIHAAQTVDESACFVNGIDPDKISTGVVIGVVDLNEIKQMDETAFNILGKEHLSPGIFKAPLYGWKLINPRILEKPVPITGRREFFNVPDNLITITTQSPLATLPYDQVVSMDSRVPFELQVKIESGTNPSLASYRLALVQRHSLPPASQKELSQNISFSSSLICELGGTALKAIADAVLEALRLNGYAATDLGIKRREPFYLTEESGVRLALIFLAIRPISKISRIEEISRGIRAMAGEELYYWFSKITSNGQEERAQKALRILLASE